MRLITSYSGFICQVISPTWEKPNLLKSTCFMYDVVLVLEKKVHGLYLSW